MPACEKCWSDAHRGEQFSVAEEYARLIDERNCTPEEQAGPEAAKCSKCGRMTVHQYAKVCVICGWGIISDGTKTHVVDGRYVVRRVREYPDSSVLP